MKVVHVCLFASYNSGWNYQDNMLSDADVKAGHKCTLITTPYENRHNSEGYKISEQTDYVEANGVHVIRLQPSKFLGKKAQMKIHAFPKLYKTLEAENPDVLFFHGLGSWAMLTVARYLRNNPKVKAYADFHGSPYNSARNFLSKIVLHGIFYKLVINLSKRYFRKIFYVGIEGADFLKELYGLSTKNGDSVEFFTLGGVPVSENVYFENRVRLRDKYGLADGEVAFLHTGKMNRAKGLIDALRVFDELKLPNAKLFLAGEFSADTESEAKSIIAGNKNIKYLGWLDGSNLIEHMCSFDVLVQPRSQSVTYQQALCTKMAVILDNNDNNNFLVSGGGGITIKDNSELAIAYRNFAENAEYLKQTRTAATEFAKNELYYSMLVQRYLK